MKSDSSLIEFDWNKGNTDKNLKHKVSDKESEEPFFDKRKYIFKDRIHSQKEVQTNRLLLELPALLRIPLTITSQLKPEEFLLSLLL